jgi:hypothetical protein
LEFDYGVPLELEPGVELVPGVVELPGRLLELPGLVVPLLE